MRCPECDSEILAGHRICSVCGYELTQEEWLASKHQKRGMGAKGICAIVLAVVLLAGGGAALILRGARGGSQNMQQAAVDLTVTAAPVVTTAPVATAAPAVTAQPTVVASEAPEANQQQTSVASSQTGQSGGQYAPSHSRILRAPVNSPEDLFGMLRKMREEGYTTAECTELNLSRDEVSYIMNNTYGIEYTRIMGSKFTIGWYAGITIWHAIQRGEEDSLSTEHQQILQRAREIVGNLIQPGMSDLEKEKAIYNYIVVNTEYAVDPSRNTQNVIGVLGYGVGQCSGYSDAFFLLGRLAGLEIDGVAGETPTGDSGEMEPHAWSLIRLDGLWYGVDVTWDDPVGDSETLECTMYYMNIPHAAFEGHRIWPEEQMPEGAFADTLDQNWGYADVPRCTSESEAARQVVAELRAGQPGFVILDGPGLNWDQVSSEVAAELGPIAYLDLADIADANLGLNMRRYYLG